MLNNCNKPQPHDGDGGGRLAGAWGPLDDGEARPALLHLRRRRLHDLSLAVVHRRQHRLHLRLLAGGSRVLPVFVKTLVVVPARLPLRAPAVAAATPSQPTRRAAGGRTYTPAASTARALNPTPRP
eukprot:1124551-Prorocentrum_minimum.AAC.1